jgi:AcrR family transcriptional regulator
MMPRMVANASGGGTRRQLTDVMLRIVAESGLDRLTVREVAAAAGVSIGTVQHHFPTKDAMLAAAYGEVVSRIRRRLGDVRLGADVRRNLGAVLSELLPADEHRAAETRVHLAFAARAATMPTLAEIQRTALAEIHDALTAAFTTAAGGRWSRASSARRAHAALAIADGLALHAVSSGDWLSRRQQSAVLALALDALLA